MAATSQKLCRELVSDYTGVGKLIRIHRQDSKGHSYDLSDLKVAFQRTVRVSDNDSNSNLRPGMGSFPLFETLDYQEKLPSAMVAKGGYFFPMYQREALWIRLESHERFAAKVYVGKN